FDAEGNIQIRAVHPAAFREDVARAAGDLTSDGDAAVAILHRAIANDHVFNGNADAAAVIVAAGLKSDAVVTGVEGAPFNQDVAARLRIASIVVGPVAVDVNAPDNHIRA